MILQCLTKRNEIRAMDHPDFQKKYLSTLVPKVHHDKSCERHLKHVAHLRHKLAMTMMSHFDFSLKPGYGHYKRTHARKPLTYIIETMA